MNRRDDRDAPAAARPAGERRWADTDGEHIDVRGLAPPQPLVAVLTLIESTPDLAALTVHLDRDPVMLYPELAERNWVAEAIDRVPGDVVLRLRPAAG